MKVSRKGIAIAILCVFFGLLIVTLIIQVKKAGQISEAALIQPKAITVGHTLDKGSIVKLIRASQLFYTFWDTGEYKYLNAVTSPHFVDHTPFQGQSQGVDGLKLASNQLRVAVPDLRCSIEDPPTGKPIAFTAIDILRVNDGKVVEAWHVEDNLAFLQQLKIVTLK
jgi:hypothetical protein